MNEWVQGAQKALNDAVEQAQISGKTYGIPTELLVGIAQAHATVAIAEQLERVGDLLEALIVEPDPQDPERMRLEHRSG